MRLLFAAAAAKVGIGLLVSPWAFAAEPWSPRALPSWYYVALLLIFGISGTLLYVGGKRDVRARLLGLVFMLFGTLFTDRLIEGALTGIEGPGVQPLALITHAHLTAFVPLMLWQFAWAFPRVQPALALPWVPTLVTRTCFVIGALLFIINIVNHAIELPGALEQVAGLFSPYLYGGAVYWPLIALLVMPALALLVAKLGTASDDERRRLAWVVTGIVAGTLPMVTHVLLAILIPRYGELTEQPEQSRPLGMTLTAFALIIPAATAYAVRVERALDVQFVIRRAVQYALARYTVIALTVGVIIASLAMVYRHRDQPIGELIASSPLLGAGLVLTAVALWGRRALLDAIDRRFFREHYDARVILLDLIDRSHAARTARDIIALITSEVDRALHLERISLLLRDEDGQFREPEGRVRSLDGDGALGSLIAGSPVPLDVDLSMDSSPLGRLPGADREWLADAAARLIVPLFGAQGRALGLLVLGDKRSEVPFTTEDRKLLTAVATAAALSLEQRIFSESPNPDVAVSRTLAARQCVKCDRVQDRKLPNCRVCGGTMTEAPVPAVLGGKFELERQIGAGGMSVVYRARDLMLNRPVAVKVLPRVVPEAAARLRREARAMATIQHPNLAVVHALESWRGAPVLILEYLAGGTLADRIRFGPIPIAEVQALGLVIGDVLHHVHHAGYLHRDVKPSNVGYTDRGSPKLLDFGLVRLVSQYAGYSTAATPIPASRAEEPDSAFGGALRVLTSLHQFVGTPAYLSPEALTKAPPTEAIDLWGLAVTLYEALTGRNPFAAPTLGETLNLIAVAGPPDPREARPDCPESLAMFFAAALAIDPKRRPQNAGEFVSRLREAL